MNALKADTIAQPRDEHLQHIVELVAAATGGAAAALSLRQGEEVVTVAQSRAVRWTTRLLEMLHGVIDSGQPKLVSRPQAGLVHRLAGVQVGDAPVETLRIVPVFAAGGAAIGTLSIFGTVFLPGSDKPALDLPRRFAGLIEEILATRGLRGSAPTATHGSALAA